MKFQLFRVKVFFHHNAEQPDLFEPSEVPRKEIISQAIKQNLSAQVTYKRFTWHIGNIERIEENALYFALGRTSQRTLPIFDEQYGNFSDNQFEEAPYTHVIIDLGLQIIAIAAQNRLVPTVNGISRQLEKLLNISVSSQGRNCSISITPLSDPQKFIEYIRNAYSVNKFTFNFTLPNLFDVNEDFEKPMQKLLCESYASNGQTEIKGENLNIDVLEELTRSSAAAGNNVKAVLKSSQNAKPSKKELKGNSVSIDVSEFYRKKELELLQKMRKKYQEVRHNEKS